MRVLTVKDFIKHLREDGNFACFGKYIVNGKVVIPFEAFKKTIFLGHGTFKNGIDCGCAHFNKSFPILPCGSLGTVGD